MRRAALALALACLEACAPRAPLNVAMVEAPRPAAEPAAAAPAAIAPAATGTLTPLEREGLAIAQRACTRCHALGVVPRAPEADVDSAGPDLSREGGKYPDLWHYHHLRDPRSTTPGSSMPRFASLLSEDPARELEARSAVERDRQASAIAQRLVEDGAAVRPGAQIIAVIAFVQSLGRDLPAEPPPQAATPISDASLLALVPSARAAGEPLWRSTCAACHGQRGEGLIGPNLTDAAWLHGSRPSQIYAVIADGVASRGMPGWRAPLGDDKVALMTAYVLAELAGRNLARGRP